MAASFHVYVDGAVDASPAGLQKLAGAMAQRYGLSPVDLAARLGKGRVRVKANVDQQTASTYASDLRAIGAKVTLEPIEGGAPAPRTTTPPPATKLPASPPRPTTPPPGGFHSGLAAAFSADSPA